MFSNDSGRQLVGQMQNQHPEMFEAAAAAAAQAGFANPDGSNPNPAADSSDSGAPKDPTDAKPQ